MKKYYAVIDTNVVVSALIKAGSTPWQIINCITDGTIIPLLTNEVIAEYIEVLSRPKFNFSNSDISDIIEELLANGLFIDPQKTNITLSDPDDVIFYEIVMESQKSHKDSYLITGNIKHFPKEPFVVTPSEMLEIIKNNA